MKWFLLFIFGCGVGSFLNVCIHRIPLGESVFYPSSYCPKCRRSLLWKDKIPIFSYIFLGGRCRFCSTRISFQYPVIEILTSILFILLFRSYSFSWDFVSFTLLSCLAIVIAVIDIRCLKIPNSLILFGLLLTLAVKGLGATQDWLNSVIGFGVGGMVLYLLGAIGKWLFRRQSMGGGDIKLAAVLGLFFGWQGILLILWLASLLGAIFGIAGVCIGKLRIGAQIPFGFFICLSVLVYIFFGPEAKC